MRQKRSKFVGPIVAHSEFLRFRRSGTEDRYWHLHCGTSRLVQCHTNDSSLCRSRQHWSPVETATFSIVPFRTSIRTWVVAVATHQLVWQCVYGGDDGVNLKLRHFLCYPSGTASAFDQERKKPWKAVSCPPDSIVSEMRFWNLAATHA